MRIEAYNKVNSIYQANNAKKINKVQTKSSYDQVEISRSGQDYQIAKKAVANTQDIRQEKVNDIKKRIASGTYNIKLEDVAEKMVDAYFDQSI